MFPGQGSQYVGMCRDIYETDSRAKDIFNEARGILGFDIAEIMFNGPESELTKSKNTQVALLLHSYTVFSILREKLDPLCACGHSLGEYTALLSADVIGFEAALKLVRRRGELMSEAGERAKGAMAAVIGLESSLIEDSIREIEGVVVANYNGEAQTVISGSESAIENAMKILTEKGAKRVIKLNVSGAFHSPLMNYAYEEFSSFIDSFEFKDPSFPVIMNVTGDYCSSGSDIRELLKRQIVSPVRWTQTMNLIVASGADRFIEIGASKVLTGMLKRAASGKECISLDKSEDITNYME